MIYQEMRIFQYTMLVKQLQKPPIWIDGLYMFIPHIYIMVNKWMVSYCFTNVKENYTDISFRNGNWD
jgi:hypothetical protein